MTKEQFLNAVGEIDDKYIKIMYDASDESDPNDEIDPNDEKPQVVHLTNRHVPFWKIAVTAAALVAVLAAGIFAVSRLNGISPVGPNRGAISKNTEQSGGNDESGDTSEQSSQSSSESSTDSNAPEDSAAEYEYKMAHRFDKVIKQRGIYGETEIPDIHYENADQSGVVTHSPHGDEWEYIGLESIEFERHTFGDYTIRLVGHYVRTDKEYFPDRIFVSWIGVEVEKDGVKLSENGSYYLPPRDQGPQFSPEKIILIDKIGSYLDFYDLEYPVISMKYYYTDDMKWDLGKIGRSVDFAVVMNGECVSLSSLNGSACTCEPGCGLFFDTDTEKYAINKEFRGCKLAVFEAEEFIVVDKKTLFDEKAGITYTFRFRDSPDGVWYYAEKNVGSAQDWFGD